MQTFIRQIIRQNANFALYTNIAKCNYLDMDNASADRPEGDNSRPWLTRGVGECAFPVDGEGAGLRACCRPCGRARYCVVHAAGMRARGAPSAAEFERDILRFLEQGR